MNFIQVRNVSHGYTAGGFFSKRHKVQVLKGLDLDLQAGQSLGLLGSSGSGKSTLARLLMGLETPDQGSIEFEGQPLQGLNPLFLQRVQMVFQDAISAFNPLRSIGWSIAEPLRHLSEMSSDSIKARVEQLLQQVKLSPGDIEKLPAQLSGGQLQRAGIARALAVNPQMIILDEALSNLDRVLQVQILDLLAEVRRESGTGFLLITHDLSLVRRFCQRVVVLAEGKLVEDRAVTPLLRFAHPAALTLQDAVLPAMPKNRQEQGAA
ncbi:nickel import ATP-binding protein NikE [Pseudomonas endophytica]|uniref:Nickel import ATP-binding protein NikE n=1 Tax=Pseudomonas endophytica TaxID=1563157 RepID=A0A0Q0T251_9PSED|nr:nickel import ATP-binding protein NikE [Pseudomonas endophytica]KQB53907.1 nickel import ATP-binding protein NikE [Pseudomonas endophytica]